MNYPARLNAYEPPRHTAPGKQRSATQPKSVPALRSEPFGEAPPVRIEDNGRVYKLSMALHGIEPRMVYVIATARSMLIEIRQKSVARAQIEASGVTETLDRRSSREFHFPVEIRRGGTVVLVRGGVLEITARKCAGNPVSVWSELINCVTLDAAE